MKKFSKICPVCSEEFRLSRLQTFSSYDYECPNCKARLYGVCTRFQYFIAASYGLYLSYFSKPFLAHLGAEIIIIILIFMTLFFVFLTYVPTTTFQERTKDNQKLNLESFKINWLPGIQGTIAAALINISILELGEWLIKK